MNFRSLSIRTRLLAGFCTLAGMVLVVSAYSLHALGDATTGFNDYLNGLNARADMAAKVRRAVDRRAVAARNMVLVTDAAELQQEKAEALRAHEDVQTRLARLSEMVRQPGVSDEARRLVDEVVKVEAQYGPVATAIVGLAAERKTDEAVSRIDKQCRPLLAALIKATNTYAEFTAARQKEMERKLEADYERQRNLLILVSLVSAGLAVAGGILITRAITRPIQRAVEVAGTVASGDLGARIEVDRHDETGRLLAALRDMNERLAATVTHVRASSGNIAVSTSEIARGNADLSSRTEEQAASLEETAASMEELTETVRQNTENARQASELARNAADVAQRGSTTVQRVVGTMQDISASSAKIAEITGIIEGIAFQTNILALNAAVEAARAGEQGRGFAVVASEVRGLAQRSSSAAKEIKELIEASGRQVHDGSSLATEAGQTMAEVTQAVARVTGIVEEIATASAEQTRGIEQVNQAIVQIDQVTQQNASLVSEAADASRALEEQGRELSEVVAFFRLPGEGGGSHLAAGTPGTQRRTAHRLAAA
ncbi:methyl-accepting chemotaxis protein [Cupriavidus sp. TMH.W2]|uniref:methyl-accepting chemotaxis protein n=1 Tax=Cupriavidus sp. TMH.W2 TaxID=3434465 RepID=UPI003D7746CE